MIFNRRKKYNGRVAALLPALGIQESDFGVFSLLDTLDIAWSQNYTEYEAALLVSYTVYGGMMRAGEPRAADVKSSIARVQGDWLAKGLVSKDLVARFSEKVGEWESEKNTSETQKEGFPPEEEVSRIFLANLPDPAASRPIDISQFSDGMIAYYENATSVGEKLGVPGFMSATKTAVVSVKEQPLCIYRYEKGPLGEFALVEIKANGAISNFGQLDGDTRTDFMNNVKYYLLTLHIRD
ncbi:MAG TPA: hypothetical protein DIU07_19935 [Rhodobacteraceae bacterium]|nr:hypothetical protein [Paracoccaceae bacterium]